MNDFIAIDVETANFEASSICAIGAVKVRGGIIVDSRYSLVNPEPCWYASRCVAVHGITDRDTWNAPSFGTLWKSWQEWMKEGLDEEGEPVFVAHNAAFDSRCIREACRIYGLEAPEKWDCTLIAARKTPFAPSSEFLSKDTTAPSTTRLPARNSALSCFEN